MIILYLFNTILYKLKISCFYNNQLTIYDDCLKYVSKPRSLTNFVG